MGDKKLFVIGSVAAAALLAAGAVLINMRSTSGDTDDKFAQCRKGVVSGGAGSLGGSFELTDENGAQVTDIQVFDEPSIFYFGYSSCPDVCPLDNARNAEATDILEEHGYRVKPVFISVDPKRDTPEVLRGFTDVLHPRMLGLTGTTEQINAATKAWRTYYKLNDQDDPDYYLVDHSTQSYLVLPGEGTVEFFNRDTSAEEMADRITCFLDAGK